MQAAPARRRRRPRGKEASGGGAQLGLLERERELERIAASLSNTSAGPGRLVVIEGAAGLGKSRLFRWTVERAHEAGMLALSARSGEPERDFSFGLALQLFERWLAAADVQTREQVLSGSAALSLPLFEGQHWGRVREPGEPAAESLVHGLFWVAVNLSARQPLLLAVDDVHWSDASSLRFLLYLVERVEDLPVTLVVTRRSGEPDRGLLEELAHHRLAERMVLSPLSESAVAALIAGGVKKAPGERFVHACYAATGGNPFLIQAIAQAVGDDRIEPDDRNAEMIERLRPEVVTRHALSRISRLGPDALALAAAVAVLGDGALLAHAATIANLEPDTAASTADALGAAGVVVSAPPVSFVHPLLRAAVYEEIPPAQRARLHARAGRLLHDEHYPSEIVAAQLLPAVRVAESWAVECLRGSAARALGAGNPESAIRYLARALREPLTREQRAETLLELAQAEATIGESGAEDHLREALSLMDDPRQQARAHYSLGSLLYTHARTPEAARSFEQGLALLETADDPLARDLRAGYFSAASLVPELATRAAEHILPLLDRGPGGETTAERGAMAALAAYRTTSGAPREEPIALARRAWGGGQLLAEEGPDGWAWSLLTGTFSWTDEFDESLQISRAVIDEARRTGSLMAYATASFCALGPAYWGGSLVEARAHGEAALDAARYGWRAFLYGATAWHSEVLIDQDELDAADRQTEIVGLPEYGTAPGRAWLRCTRARVRLLQGRADEALNEALQAGEVFEQMGAANTLFAPWRPMAALAAHRLGQDGRAQEWLRRQLEIARGTGTPSHIASVLRTQAVIGSDRQAIKLLRQALAMLEGSQARLERLRCAADLGGALRRTGQRAEAREILSQAADQAHRAGARLIERQVHEELRVAGARPRRLAFSGVESLTASERRVAEMAIQGLSNRDIAQALFVTPRTVERHLYTAYKKLGINSRAELASSLREQSEDEDV